MTANQLSLAKAITTAIIYFFDLQLITPLNILTIKARLLKSIL